MVNNFFPLQQYGLRLKFVDIDLETLNYNLNSLESSITEKTKMIIAVNLLGNPNDFDRINQIIKGKNIFFILKIIVNQWGQSIRVNKQVLSV